jgi:uncharacterized protein (DUF2236 family)
MPDRRSHSSDRARTHAERLGSRDGYFPPESVIRRVGNTPVTPFLGGGTAVLLQVAHPLVALGVAEHSDYRNDLWRRLGRTLRALYMITFGTRAEAERAGAAVQAVHVHIRGTTSRRLGCFPPGTSYSADDPELMLWVHATLVEASLSAYQRFERRLSTDEQEEYYAEMALVARIFGVPASVLPATLGGFREYFADQLDGPAITVTALAREIAEVILRAPLPTPMRLLAPAHRLATAAQLPPRLRDEYGLHSTPRDRLRLAAAGKTLKLTAWPALQVAARLRPPLATAPSAARS